MNSVQELPFNYVVISRSKFVPNDVKHLSSTHSIAAKELSPIGSRTPIGAKFNRGHFVSHALWNQ